MGSIAHMPSLPKKLIDTATDIGRKAVETAGRLVRSEDDESPSTSPETVGAPKPGTPAAPKSGTARKPRAVTPKAKPSGRGATARSGPEPVETANAAAATPTEGPVPTGRTKKRPAASARKR